MFTLEVAILKIVPIVLKAPVHPKDMRSSMKTLQECRPQLVPENKQHYNNPLLATTEKCMYMGFFYACSFLMNFIFLIFIVLDYFQV